MNICSAEFVYYKDTKSWAFDLFPYTPSVVKNSKLASSLVVELIKLNSDLSFENLLKNSCLLKREFDSKNSQSQSQNQSQDKINIFLDSNYLKKNLEKEQKSNYSFVFSERVWKFLVDVFFKNFDIQNTLENLDLEKIDEVFLLIHLQLLCQAIEADFWQTKVLEYLANYSKYFLFENDIFYKDLEISICSQLDLTCPIKIEEFAFFLSKTDDAVDFAIEYFLDKQSVFSYEEENDFTDLTEMVETALFRGQMILNIEKEKSHKNQEIQTEAEVEQVELEQVEVEAEVEQVEVESQVEPQVEPQFEQTQMSEIEIDQKIEKVVEEILQVDKRSKSLQKSKTFQKQLKKSESQKTIWNGKDWRDWRDWNKRGFENNFKRLKSLKSKKVFENEELSFSKTISKTLAKTIYTPAHFGVKEEEDDDLVNF